ncbi:PIG-L deacetylase family protein [Falsiroseomonas sp. HC035]|uniref:PIG-L deacetylase family protein n=1 Tax=Falsiroseomonas sp. HC035 TaxID=3390999 RepID=UPI003D3213F8
MKAGAWLRRAQADLPLTADPAEALGGAGPLLVLAPHPDDESLGCGALLAACAAEGRLVHVVVVSDGRLSHPRSRTHPAERLVALRQAEARSAVAELGLDPARDLSFLGLPDCGVPTGGAPRTAAVEALRGLVPFAPAIVLGPWRHDPHADHAATAAIAVALAAGCKARLRSYVVWGWAFVTPPPGFGLGAEPEPEGAPQGWRFSAGRHLAAKRLAVAAHRSQTTGLIADDPTGFRLGPEALALFQQPEELVLA